jgi:hypothetical protein
MRREHLAGYHGPPPMHCLCCGKAESTSGCVRGFTCGCDYSYCRVCHKCKRHCACEWKVTVLFDGCLEAKTDHEGRDFEEVEKRVGHLALIQVTDRIIVYKNGEQYRRIDLR